MPQKAPPPSAPTDKAELKRLHTLYRARIRDYDLEESEERKDELLSDVEPLSVMVDIVKTVQLAWGGPEYGYKISFDPHMKVIDGVFYYKDWGTYEEMPIDDEELASVVSTYGLDIQ